MRALAAKQPNGLSIVDQHRKNRNHALVLTRRRGLKGREDALGAGVHAGDGHAGPVEAGLRDRVVARPELELHHAAWLGLDLVGEELEGCLVLVWVFAHGYDVYVDGCARRGVQLYLSWALVGGFTYLVWWTQARREEEM